MKNGKEVVSVMNEGKQKSAPVNKGGSAYPVFNGTAVLSKIRDNVVKPLKKA